DQALQGQIPGVVVSTNSGSPGGTSSIRIRGLSTFGDNDPLILVDGVVYDSEGLNALNPNDIASINVLKDATAGIYGVRAANGVIIVETKKGQLKSAPRWEISGFQGLQQTAKKLDLLNAKEYAVLKNEMFAAGGEPMPFKNTSLGEGTNWQDSIFKLAPVYQYNVSVSGGNEKSTYSLGGSIFDQQGLVGLEKANFNRLNGRANFDTKMSDKLRYSSVFLYTNEKRSALPENGIGSVLYNTINAFPTDPIRGSNGKYTYLEEVADIINPFAQMENTYNWAWVNKFVGKQELTADINENLTFTNRFNYNYALVDNKSFSPLAWFGLGKAQNTALNENLDPTMVEIAPDVKIERGASVSEGKATYGDLNFESFLNHQKEFVGGNKLKTTAGVSVFQRRGNYLGGTAYNIPNNSLDFADISANLAPGGFLNNVYSWEFKERLLSAFVRSEYNMKNRYFLSGILRRDGSSKFGPNARWGWFPTLSGAWLISDEDFYNVKWMRTAKLRMSYGVSGNDQIENFAYRGLLNGEGDYIFNDIIVKGVAIGRASNPDLKWESTSQFNVGADVTLGRKFTTTVNYFVKRTKDLLFQPEVSGVLGTAGPGSYPPIINAGDVSNSGVELDIQYQNAAKKRWNVSMGLNFAYLKNVVLATPKGVDFIPGAAFGVGGNTASRFQKDYPIGFFMGYETAGIFQTQAEIDNATVKQAGAKPGDLKFVDQNGDGIINFSDDSDKKMLGSPLPKFTAGYNLSVSHKGLDISMQLYAAVGQKIVRNYERQQPYANQLAYTIGRWTGPNSTNENPRLTTSLTRNNVFSDYYVEDGSFLRLRNLQIGYTLKGQQLQKLKMNGLRIYLSANNLYTLTKYMGYDPDLGSVGGALGAGIDNGFYPQARSIMMGFSIRF
ncbi:MAG: SusC/RagA family TonB-linked outer membrane protein, partial [Bacteroidota bacterium]